MPERQRSAALLIRPAVAVAAALALSPLAAWAQKTQPYDGFLCCSLLSDGSWISDQAYDDGYKKVVPAGTPVKFTGFGRWRMYVEIDGKKLGLGNDYSRTIDMDEFAARYVLVQDPKAKMQQWPARVREAVLARKVMRGMTREQVAMALGHPSTSSNPDPKQPLWNYRHRMGDYQIFWTDDGRVDQVFGPAEVRAKVFAE